MTIDHETKSWIKNISDERAALAGCRFDEERGRFTVNWIERFCRLYEGIQWAGKPLKLLPWALDATLRMFGWVVWNDQWQQEVRRFKQASIWASKKAAKSPTMASWGLYLLCGDGEQGQKVFFAAKDGNHARKIVGEHIQQMLYQSKELMDECKINQTTMRISHLRTKSYIEPLSSSNSRTQESKEGLNGSLLLDETHIVDWAFMRRLTRMGMSRIEPFQIEVSTAGNNPDSYGRDRFNYAIDVERGAVTDQQLFVAIHAAPQKLTDEELEADPLKYGRMANPSLGITVDPAEYLQDYERSKRKIQDFLDFKMYRLNIWQKGSNPWLRQGDWEKCRSEFTEADLLGQKCWAGLDLSRKRDMTALVLVFKGDDPEEYLLLPYFWLPQGRAEELQGDIPILEWERGGHIELTPGPVTDYGFVKGRFRKLAQKFDIQELAYDPHYGEEVTQSLAEGTTDDEGKCLEEGTGVERFVFDQKDTMFAAPTDDFERLVIAGTLRHNGNPVLDWQAGHAQVMKKVSKVNRVVKPDANSYKGVDGIVGAIMGLARAMQAPEESTYHYGDLRK